MDSTNFRLKANVIAKSKKSLRRIAGVDAGHQFHLVAHELVHLHRISQNFLVQYDASAGTTLVGWNILHGSFLSLEGDSACHRPSDTRSGSELCYVLIIA